MLAMVYSNAVAQSNPYNLYRIIEREENCFSQFQYQSTSRSDVNAYLLANLTHLIYKSGVRRNLTYNHIPPPAVINDKLFHKAFIARTKHFFKDSQTICTISEEQYPKEPEFICHNGKIYKTKELSSALTQEEHATRRQFLTAVQQQRINSIGLNPDTTQAIGTVSVSEEYNIDTVSTVSSKTGKHKLFSLTKNLYNDNPVAWDDFIQSIKYIGLILKCDSLSQEWEKYEKTVDSLDLVQENCYKNNNTKFMWIHKNNGNGLDPECMIISKQNYIIVIFRGTDEVGKGTSKKEWITTDGDFIQTTTDYIGGRVHKGFKTSLEYHLRPKSLPMNEKIMKELIKYGVRDKKLWITGHSLGGAQAQLLGAFLKHNDIPVQGIYVYGSPRVGDNEFKNRFEDLFPNHTLQRFEFMDDPAPKLPLLLTGYKSAGTRNFYSSVYSYRFNKNETNLSTEATSALKSLFTSLIVPPFGFLWETFSNYRDFCFHHPEWYVRASFNQLSSSEKARLPSFTIIPNSEWDACFNNEVDRALNR